MKHTLSAIPAMPSPDQAKAALQALRSGQLEETLGDLALGDLFSQGNPLGLPTMPSMTLPSGWEGSTPLVALMLLAMGVILWIGGDKLLRGGAVMLFGMLGAAGAILLELLDAGVFTSRSLMAGGIGGVGGMCLGFLMSGVLSRMICVSTGAVIALLTLAFMESPLTGDAQAPEPKARTALIGEPPAAPQNHLKYDFQSGRAVIQVAATDQAKTQHRLDERAASNTQRQQDAQTDSMSRSLDILPSEWTADPGRTLAAASLGATCGLGISFLFSGWARRLAAASLGAALGVGASAALLPTIGGATPDPTLLAGSWLLLTVVRAAIPAQKKPGGNDDNA